MGKRTRPLLMKMEYLAGGAEGCPLIRLFDYRAGEVDLLCDACLELPRGLFSDFALHELRVIEAIDGCRFVWRLGSRDVGVRIPISGEVFVLELSTDAWREVHDKLLPFINGSGGYNWLSDEGEVNVLISKTGAW